MATRGESILVVEDERSARDTMVDFLSEAGYEAQGARDGEEAVLLYERSWRDIDIVILDLIMPKMNGEEAFARMQKINPNIKVILSSGYSVDDQAARLLNQGAMDFIQKPFDIKELCMRIEKALSEKKENVLV